MADSQESDGGPEVLRDLLPQLLPVDACPVLGVRHPRIKLVHGGVSGEDAGATHPRKVILMISCWAG